VSNSRKKKIGLDGIFCINELSMLIATLLPLKQGGMDEKVFL
jgi:hypothetical protein